jgi:NADH:ubiquinone reductase (H+-translocating)
LLPGFQQKARALSSWAAGYVTHSPSQVVVGRPD